MEIGDVAYFSAPVRTFQSETDGSCEVIGLCQSYLVKQHPHSPEILSVQPLKIYSFLLGRAR